MSKDHANGWREFELMVRAGMPHAREIASYLSASDLSVPTVGINADAIADLRFYCVVHRAYRLGKLEEYLQAMAIAKNCSTWSSIRDSKQAQNSLLDVCVSGQSISDATSQLASSLAYNGQVL